MKRTPAQHTFAKWCKGPENQRRLDLIDGKLAGTLTPEEEAEFAVLQERAGELRHASFMDSLRPDLRAMLEREAEAEEQPAPSALDPQEEIR